MNISIRKIISLPFIIQFFRVNTKKQKEFICSSVARDIEEIVKDDSFTAGDVKKNTHLLWFVSSCIFRRIFLFAKRKNDVGFRKISINLPWRFNRIF